MRVRLVHPLLGHQRPEDDLVRLELEAWSVIGMCLGMVAIPGCSGDCSGLSDRQGEHSRCFTDGRGFAGVGRGRLWIAGGSVPQRVHGVAG